MRLNKEMRALRDKLRLKIEQARKNGFTVLPWRMPGDTYSYGEGKWCGVGHVSVTEQVCCLTGAAKDLEDEPGFNYISWIPNKICRILENGFEGLEINRYMGLFDSELPKNAEAYFYIGQQLRKECLDYNRRKSKSLNHQHSA